MVSVLRRLVQSNLVERYSKIMYPHFVMPMGNVSKYVRKLVMGIYNDENQSGVCQKIYLNLDILLR